MIAVLRNPGVPGMGGGSIYLPIGQAVRLRMGFAPRSSSKASRIGDDVRGRIERQAVTRHIGSRTAPLIDAGRAWQSWPPVRWSVARPIESPRAASRPSKAPAGLAGHDILSGDERIRAETRPRRFPYASQFATALYRPLTSLEKQAETLCRTIRW